MSLVLRTSFEQPEPIRRTISEWHLDSSGRYIFGTYTLFLQNFPVYGRSYILGYSAGLVFVRSWFDSTIYALILGDVGKCYVDDEEKFMKILKSKEVPCVLIV
jgi:hypothetical protein